MVKCPYCEEEIEPSTFSKDIIKAGILKMDKIVYSCPKCGKVLGLVNDN